MNSSDTPDPSKPENDHFNILNWKNTECILYQAPLTPPRALPNDARQRHSLLLDREGSHYTDDDILDHFSDDLVGVSFHPGRKFVQLFFDSEHDADRVLRSGPHSINNQPLLLFPPKGKLPSRFVLKLANTPIFSRARVEKALTETFSPLFKIIEIAPYTIKGTKILTSRWDLVVEPLPSNPTLQKIPVIFKILGETILASWPGSDLLTTC